MKKIYGIILVILLLLAGCTNGPNTGPIEKTENPFFTTIESNSSKISEREVIEDKSKTSKPIVRKVINTSKLAIISDDFDSFYKSISELISDYETGNLISLVNIFLNNKIQENYLINQDVDKEIIKNTTITITNAFVTDNNQLVMELKIEYVPVLVNLLLSEEPLDVNNFSEYSNFPKQIEYFTIDFDMPKYSESEGIKIKNYKYKDNIIRALTNTIYDSKKYVLEYSEENNQEFFNTLILDLQNRSYENQAWITENTIKNITENQEFFDIMLEKISIKSISDEYYIITYPDIKNNIDRLNITTENIVELINTEQIPIISKIIHDPDLNKLHSFIQNLMFI